MESLDEIISVHKEYQSLIYDRCLLNPKVLCCGCIGMLVSLCSMCVAISSEVSAMATVVAPAGTIHKGCHHKHPHSVLGVCRTMEAEVCSKVCVCCTCSSEHIYSGSPGRAGTKLTPIFVVNVVTHLLDLAVLCCWFWLHRWSEMCKIESEFSKCSHFLNTILMNSVKRGSFPHCKFSTTPHSVTFRYTVHTFVPCVW